MAAQACRGAVVVIGSINADVVVTCPALPPPGATVLGHAVEVLPGGKGLNQAVAAARAGDVEVRLVGCIGDDAWGEQVRAFLTRAGLDAAVVLVGAPTGVAVVSVADDGENSIVVVPGANRHPSIHATAAEAAARLGPGDVVVAQLEIPPEVVVATFETAVGAGATTVLNPSPISASAERCAERAAVVVVNEHEAPLLGLPARRRPGQQLVITRGAVGATLVDDQGSTHFEPRPATVVDTTGAGDCFTGVLAAGLAGSASIDDSIRRALIASSLQVERAGAAPAMPTAADIAAAGEIEAG